MDGEIFPTYLEHCFVPTLSPGDIVGMDNLPAYKVTGVREIPACAIASAPFFKPSPQKSARTTSHT
jgi:hypothetical protein